jgi:hypothetical protein
MTVKYIRLESGEAGENQVPSQPNRNKFMMMAKLGFLVLAGLCVFVYVSDVLLDMNWNPIKQRKPISGFFKCVKFLYTVNSRYKTPSQKQFQQYPTL